MINPNDIQAPPHQQFSWSVALLLVAQGERSNFLVHKRRIYMKLQILVMLLTISLLGCAVPPTEEQLRNADYGPYPYDYKEIITNHLDKILKDPDSAQVDFKGFLPTQQWSSYFGNTKYGYAICVDINAKNSFGGYTGRQTSYFLINNGYIVQEIHEDSNYNSMDSMAVRQRCSN